MFKVLLLAFCTQSLVAGKEEASAAVNVTPWIPFMLNGVYSKRVLSHAGIVIQTSCKIMLLEIVRDRCLTEPMRPSRLSPNAVRHSFLHLLQLPECQ